MINLNIPQTYLLIIGFVIIVLLLTMNGRSSGGWISQHEGTDSKYKCGLSAMLPIICHFKDIAIEHLTNLRERIRNGELKMGSRTLMDSDLEPIHNNIKITPEIVEYMYRYLQEDNCVKILDPNIEYKLHNLCNIPKLWEVYHLRYDIRDSIAFNHTSFLRAMLNISGNFSDSGGSRILHEVWKTGGIELPLSYKYKVGYVNKRGYNPRELCYVQIWEPYRDFQQFQHVYRWIGHLCRSSRKEDNTIPIITAFVATGKGHIMSVIYEKSLNRWIWYNDNPGIPPKNISIFRGEDLQTRMNIEQIHTFGIFIKYEDLSFIEIGPRSHLSLYDIKKSLYEKKGDVKILKRSGYLTPIEFSGPGYFSGFEIPVGEEVVVLGLADNGSDIIVRVKDKIGEMARYTSFIDNSPAAPPSPLAAAPAPAAPAGSLDDVIKLPWGSPAQAEEQSISLPSGRPICVKLTPTAFMKNKLEGSELTTTALPNKIVRVLYKWAMRYKISTEDGKVGWTFADYVEDGQIVDCPLLDFQSLPPPHRHPAPLHRTPPPPLKFEREGITTRQKLPPKSKSISSNLYKYS